MRAARLASVVSSALFTTACATLISGKTETLVLTSDPPGATVLVEPGWFDVTTPIELEVKRRDGPFRLTFTMPGYEPQRVHVLASTSWWTLGNLVVPWIGYPIDRSSGADTSLDPTEIHAALVKEQ